MTRLESGGAVWDNEKGWVLQPSQGLHCTDQPVVEYACQHSAASPMQEEESELHERSAPVDTVRGDLAPAQAVRAEILRELDHHPNPTFDFPSRKRRRCVEGTSKQTRALDDAMSVANCLLAKGEGFIAVNVSGGIEAMELEEPCGPTPDKSLVSALLEAHPHATRTRLLFPADRIESFRAAAVSRGAVAV